MKSLLLVNLSFNLFDKKTLNLILEKPSLVHKIDKIKR